MKGIQPLSNRLDPAQGSSLAQVKTAQLAREEDDKNRIRRIRGMIVLVQQFLVDQGYRQALQCLQRESGLTLQQLAPADNMDLFTVFADFELYYELKTRKKPTFYRPRVGSGDGGDEGGGSGAAGERLLTRKAPGQRSSGSYAGNTPTLPSLSPPTGAHPASAPAGGESGASAQPPPHLRPIAGGSSNSGATAAPSLSSSSAAATAALSGDSAAMAAARKFVRRKKGIRDDPDVEATATFNLEGQKAIVHAATGHPLYRDEDDGGADEGEGGYGADSSNYPIGEERGVSAAAPFEFYSARTQKPLPVFPTSELNDLAATIMRDILDVNPSVRWSDIAELDSAKHLLKEAVVMPVKYPELFKGIVRPWKGILLFGPPGTGKTLLAKAVATECRTTFFNISASSVVSKWRGDSEKLVRMLFDLAVHYSPSTIFIDEVDSLMSARSSEGEHEGSRRMKTELLTQMDGLAKRRGGDVVFVLAASNTPWDLDTAMLRRLEKRVLVSLPTFRARERIFSRLLHENGGSSHSRKAGERGTADAGVDATPLDFAACAALTDGMSGADIDVVCREAMMRPIRKLIEQLENAESRSARGGAASSSPLAELNRTTVERPRVTLADVEASVACTRSSVSAEELTKYDAWMTKFGSGIST